jgi:hypothetical protein
MKGLRDTFVAIFMGIVILTLVGHVIGRSTPSATAQSQSGPILKGERYHCDKSGDYYIRCEGRVVNVSTQPLHRVLAFAQCFDRDGGFISSDWGGLEYDPLLVGQAAPYHVLVSYNPAIKRCTVSFKYLDGEVIPSIDPYQSGSRK